MFVNGTNNTRATALLLAVLLLGLDQLSKRWATYLVGDTGATLVLPGPFDLTLVFNRSNAFGLVPVYGSLSRWGLISLSLVVVICLLWAALRWSMSGPGMIGAGFIIAGAAGNALDRIKLGAVVDFIDASKIGFLWVFNLADVSLDVGVALMLWGMFLTGIRAGKRRAARMRGARDT